MVQSFYMGLVLTRDLAILQLSKSLKYHLYGQKSAIYGAILTSIQFVNHKDFLVQHYRAISLIPLGKQGYRKWHFNLSE